MSIPRSRLRVLLAAGVAVVTVFGTAVTAGPVTAAPSPASDTGRWIVQLAEPSLAAHQAPSGAVDVASASGRAYLDRLAAQQATVAELLSERLGRPVEVE